MLIRTMGFNLQGCPDVDLNMFFSNLSINTFQEGSTILRFIERDGFWVGVILSIRDQRSFCKMQEAGDSFTITIQQLQANESPVEFNVLLISKKTFKGIYLHYFHSKSLTASLTILRSLYDNFKSQFLKNELNEVDEQGKSKKAIQEIKKQIREKYKPSLSYSIWVKPESFSDMLLKLSTIKNFELEVESVAVDEAVFRPLAAISKSVKQRFSFSSSSSPVTTIRSAVTDAISNLGCSLLGAKVTGVDPSGLEVMYSLANNVDYLSTYDYDEIVAGLEIRSDDIEGSLFRSKLVTQIIAVAQSPQVSAILDTPQK